MSSTRHPEPAEGCVFCKIVSGEIEPKGWVHRDDDFIAIEDLAPQAPFHALVIPADHYADPDSFATQADPAVIAKVFSFAAQIGRERCANGFRLVVNQGVDGGQTVGHVHVHVLGGRHMNWPPG